MLEHNYIEKDPFGSRKFNALGVEHAFHVIRHKLSGFRPSLVRTSRYRLSSRLYIN